MKIKSLRNIQYFKMLEKQSQVTSSPLTPNPFPRDLRLWHHLVRILVGCHLPVKNLVYGPAPPLLLSPTPPPKLYIFQLLTSLLFFNLFHDFVFSENLELNYSHNCLSVRAVNHTITLKTTQSPTCLI